MAKRGRKRLKLTDDQADQVEKLAAMLTQEQIADFLGIGKTTWYEILKRDPRISERYKKGLSKAVAMVAQSLIKKACPAKGNGDTACQIFFLKTRGGWRESQEKEQEQSKPLEITVTVSKPAPEEVPPEYLTDEDAD